MIIVSGQNTVVAGTADVTVVSAPLELRVLSVEENVSVVLQNSNISVVTEPQAVDIVLANSEISVVTVLGSTSTTPYDGPHIYFGPTPPVGAALHDLWIVSP